MPALGRMSGPPTARPVPPPPHTVVARDCGAWVTWADGHTECVATARLLRHAHCARSLVRYCERAGRRAIEARQTEERLRQPELWAGAAILGARAAAAAAAQRRLP